MSQVPVLNWSKTFIDRWGKVVCSNVKEEESLENHNTDVDEKSPIIDLCVFAFDFDSDAGGQD